MSGFAVTVVGVGRAAMEGAADALFTLLRERGATDGEIAELADPASTQPIGEVLLRKARPTLTLDEVAGRVGLEPSDALRIWGALGFVRPGPGDLLLAEPEAEASVPLLLAWHLFGPDDTLRLARVIGTATARIADAIVSAFHARLAGPALAADPSRVALAQSVLAAEGMLQPLAEAIEVLLRRHLIAAMRPVLASYTAADHDRTTVATGFVDLVGYTTLVQEVSVGELSQLLTRLEDLSEQVISSCGGRLVKMIGDEVMFVAPSATVACLIACDILAGLDAHGLPAARGGIDFGEVLTRGGDYFGSVVNLASRLVAAAVPGEILCSQVVRDHAAGSLVEFQDRGTQTLKGIAAPQRLYAVTIGSSG